MYLAGNSHRVPLGKSPLKRLAHQLLTAACLSVLFAPEALAGDIPSQPGAVKASSSVIPAPNFAVIKADKQGYDQQLGRFVATGNVEARFNGWRLLADRVEMAEASRSIYASGQIRLIKGDQYLQASRLRYSELEGSGELDDVYGVIEQDTLPREINSQGSLRKKSIRKKSIRKKSILKRSILKRSTPQIPTPKRTVCRLTSANQRLPVRHSAQILPIERWCGCCHQVASACPPCQRQPAALAVSSPLQLYL